MENTDYESLFQILIDENNNYNLKLNDLKFEDKITSKNSAWFALIKSKMSDSANLNRCEVKEGDIFRVGKIYLRVKTIKFQNNDKKVVNLTTSNTENTTNIINKYNICFTSPDSRASVTKNGDVTVNTELNCQEIQVNSPIYRKVNQLKFSAIKTKKKIEDKKENFCRICYGEEDDNDDPLLQPCICHGSMKYIHFKCLKHWLKTNTYILTEENDSSKTFIYRLPQCELCKAKLPDIIMHKGKPYNIFDYGNEFKSYLILECLTEDKQKNKYLYIVSLDHNSQLINIGRAHDCSLVISDASISRNHCALRISNKKIFLEDCSSKFGTLVLIQSEKLRLVEQLKLYMQIGRSFIRCLVKVPFSFFGCCTVSEASNFDYYYNQNIIKDEIKPKLYIKSNDDNEEENENHMIFEENDEGGTNAYKQINIKGEGEENVLTNPNILLSPTNLKVISECVDENKNEGNISINIENNVDEIKKKETEVKSNLIEERKNN